MKRMGIIFVTLAIFFNISYASVDIEITQAYHYFKNSKYDDAIRLCNLILEKDVNNTEALFIGGISYFILKDYSNSEKYLLRFVSLNPFNYEVIKYIGISKYYNQDYKGSMAYFEKIPKYMEDPTVLIYLALNYNRLQDKDNLKMVLNKIEENSKIDHKNKSEFIQIINNALTGDIEGTISSLEKFRDKYTNQFIVSSKIMSIEEKVKQDKSENLRLMLTLSGAFDTNVVLYPDENAVKLPEVKYGERYDIRTEARYSLGYLPINTTNNTLGIMYSGYQGVNSNFYSYNFNSNNLQLFYKYTRPSFHLSFDYNYSYDFISDKFKAYAFGHRITPEFGYRMASSLISIGFPVHMKNFFEKVYSKDYDRSSILLDPYLLISYSFTKNFSIYNKNYFGINDAKGDGWKFMRPEVRLGLNYRYGKSIIFNSSASFGYFMFSEKVSNPDFLFDSSSRARTDTRLSIETTLDFRLYSDKLYLVTGYGLSKNMSNVKSGIYDYTRHIGTVGIKFVY
ncbi:MAG: hypothetical protein N2746_06295 [Deltaproteobacteria bacterium]|nr:hypothetical protein [Deltaproteobacteria bacterium]